MSVTHITNNCASINQNLNFNAKVCELQQLRQTALNSLQPQRTIAILGAGPAGLIRGIQSLLLGCTTCIFERRRENQNGRENTVQLESEAITMLSRYGILQYLTENGLIFAPQKGCVNVRLKDLETAMKAVIRSIAPNGPIIRYESEINQITTYPNARAEVTLEHPNAERTRLENLDLLVIAEGAHSTTNDAFLHNRRIEVLPPMPVLAATLKDNRPHIRGVGSFFTYMGKTMGRIAESIYYHVLYLLKAIFQKQHFWNPNRKILAAIILKTPHQDYLGSGLSKAESEKIREYQHAIQEIKEKLSEAKQAHRIAVIPQLEKELVKRQALYDKLLKHWVKLSCCASNFLQILQLFHKKCKPLTPLQFARWFPIEHILVTEIGCDYSEQILGNIGQTRYLIVGDSAATVDPTTGLGCNTAITTSEQFIQLLKDPVFAEQRYLVEGSHPTRLNSDYEMKVNNQIRLMHSAATNIRRLLRPDTLQPIRA